MWQYTPPVRPDVLAHHGILGQRWGVRRFQKTNGRLTNAGKRRYDKDTSNDGKDSKDGEKIGLFEKKTGIHLTDKQKRAIKIGAIVAGTTLVAFGGYQVYKKVTGKTPIEDLCNKAIDAVSKGAKNTRDEFTENWSNLKNKGTLSERQREDFATREVDSKWGLFKKRKSFTPDEDLAEINKGLFMNPFGADMEGSSNNCVLCTTAYEARRRGYDVKANFSKNGFSVESAANFFKGATVENDKAMAHMMAGSSYETYADAVANKLSKYGDGARGNFLGFYQGGGGHSIIWEVVDGKTIFRDGQTGRTYKSAYEAIGLFEAGSSKFFRTDNLEFNPDTIKTAITSVGLPRKRARLMETDPTQAKILRQEIVEIAKAYGMSLREAQEAVYKANNIST